LQNRGGLRRRETEKAAPFSAEIPFTVCGRARADGGKEKLSGAAVLFPAGAYGDKKTIRIRATVAGFDRDAYHIGPEYTEGWLAKVVAEQGTVELGASPCDPDGEPPPTRSTG
jgi:hypothetical protein